MVWMMKEAYKDQVLGSFTIFRWHKEFSEGRESPALIPHGSQPATTNTETNVNTTAAVIWVDWHQSVRTLTESPYISKTSVHWILTEILE